MKFFHQLLIVFFIVTVSITQTKGQCLVDIGSDTTFCVSLGQDTFQLNPPNVNGGTPPYTYTWSGQYTIGSTITLTASNFLVDTTSSTPQIINFTDDSLKLYLSVSDSLGATCNDTIIIHFCNTNITLEDKGASINQGDTIQLYTSSIPGCSPYTYQWSPNYNISDPTSPTPSVWPDTTTYYVATVTNAFGCQVVDETFEVFINPTSVDKYNNKVSMSIFPNPLTTLTTIKIPEVSQYNLTIVFYDIFGRIINKMKISRPETQIKRADFNSDGIYLYRLFNKKEVLGEGKLIVK